MPRSRSAVLREPMTPAQLRSYASLSDAIREAIDDGRRIACIEQPQLFDRARRHRIHPCTECPVLEQCRRYVESGVDVPGFTAAGVPQ